MQKSRVALTTALLLAATVVHVGADDTGPEAAAIAPPSSSTASVLTWRFNAQFETENFYVVDQFLDNGIACRILFAPSYYPDAFPQQGVLPPLSQEHWGSVYAYLTSFIKGNGSTADGIDPLDFEDRSDNIPLPGLGTIELNPRSILLVSRHKSTDGEICLTPLFVLTQSNRTVYDPSGKSALCSSLEKHGSEIFSEIDNVDPTFSDSDLRSLFPSSIGLVRGSVQKVDNSACYNAFISLSQDANTALQDKQTQRRKEEIEGQRLEEELGAALGVKPGAPDKEDEVDNDAILLNAQRSEEIDSRFGIEWGDGNDSTIVRASTSAAGDTILVSLSASCVSKGIFDINAEFYKQDGSGLRLFNATRNNFDDSIGYFAPVDARYRSSFGGEFLSEKRNDQQSFYYSVDGYVNKIRLLRVFNEESTPDINHVAIIAKFAPLAAQYKAIGQAVPPIPTYQSAFYGNSPPRIETLFSADDGMFIHLSTELGDADFAFGLQNQRLLDLMKSCIY